MTDQAERVLTWQKIADIENFVLPLDKSKWESVLGLCTSHRTLHKRHRLLLRRVKELEARVTLAEALSTEEAQ
ncbi:hypothetical protein LCGC14_1968360 [marine sediment metagenome]|uniref:Uncharacterized protein n=1 Tax=marine sediment metagenome TaxID=412755 RepID=A0A0F9G0P7_9ZZZZ